MSMTQKIIARRSGASHVEPQDHVVVNLDMIFAHDPVMAVLTRQFYSTFGDDGKIWDSNRVALFQDHLVPAKDIESTRMIQIMDKFVKEQGIHYYYPYGKNYGVCHIIMMEEGLALPGEIICGPDSHTVTYGSLNCLATGLGVFDIAVAMGTGQAWFTVPDAIRIEVSGELRTGVGAKDIILKVISELKLDGARNCSIEWGGETIENMGFDERATLCNMVVEAGATNGIMSLNPSAREYLQKNAKRDFEEVTADAGYEYARTLVIDASKLSPQVACPHSPDNVKPVAELKEQNVRVHQVYVGSCTGGKLADIEQFSETLADNSVAEGVTAIVVPATTKIYKSMLESGMIASLMARGVNVESPGCKACYGVHGGVTRDEENCLATINRNFLGRMGNPKSYIYLSSPFIAAKSAIAGFITDGV